MTKSQHNDIVVLMIPELVDIGASWKVLPYGIHQATLTEVEKRFATNKKRQQLFRGLVKACKSLKAAGCSTIYLDGSYVTDKDFPTDYDVCWNPINVDEKNLIQYFLIIQIGVKSKNLNMEVSFSCQVRKQTAPIYSFSIFKKTKNWV